MRRSSLFRLSRILLTCLALAMAGACGGDPLGPVPEGFGPFAGRWDGERWAGMGYAVLDGDTLHVVGHRPDPQHYYDEYVRVRVPFRGVGRYEVPVPRGSLAKITGGDAGYFPDAAGVLRITEYSAGERRVRGTIHLEAEGPDGRWRFEDGVFDVPVYASFRDVPVRRRW